MSCLQWCASQLHLLATLIVTLLVPAACAQSHAKSMTPAPAPIVHVRDDVVVNLFDPFGRATLGTTQSWGYSAIVRHRGRTILFDSGSNADVLAGNAAALGIDLRDVDIGILSHDHPDHSGGFDYLFSINPRAVLYAPSEFNLGSDIEIHTASPDPTLPELSKDQQYWEGTTTVRSTQVSGRYWGRRVQFVKGTRDIAPGVALIATASPNLGSFSVYPPNESKPQMEGLRELSLVLDTRDGDVLVVGCSHSGIETIVQATRALHHRPIDLATGGFHLLPYDRTAIEALAQRLRDKYDIRRLAPAHCTGHLGFQLLQREFAEHYLVGGLGSEVPIGP
jgi:7,8-dihydropterin-6-yl-methyl-4-(beta-D-ribofuranosyl)aminobenzene 5'-phosphate synthase